jgi:hypothetical protein
MDACPFRKSYPDILVAQSSIAKYMVKRHGPPSLPWRTFLRKAAKAANIGGRK